MKNRRGRRRRKKKVSGPWPGLDVDALNAVSFLGGVLLFEGRPVPLVRPRGEPADPVLFDCTVCAAGLKRFIRPILPEDQRGGWWEVGNDHLLVEQIAPGNHVKEPVQVFWRDDVSRN
jgi:hypothetical protein